LFLVFFTSARNILLAIKFLLNIDGGSSVLFCCLCEIVGNVALLFKGQNCLYFVIGVAEEKEFVPGKKSNLKAWNLETGMFMLSHPCLQDEF
jgi:hypothetical protein